MPWKANDVMDQRIEFVLRARSGEASIAQLCREYGVSRACGHKWLGRFRQAGSAQALAELSRRPRRCPSQTPDRIEERIVKLRAERGWGARKLQVLLEREGVSLPAITIHRVLVRRGLVTHETGQRSATRRFARSQCNQLLQLDFKGYYRVADGICYPLSLLDDCSRYLVGLWPLSSKATAGVKEALEGHFRDHGVPQAFLMDHGDPWWGVSNGHGLTRLSVWLMKQDIRLIYGAAYHPQTRGKVERFHRTLKERTRHEGLPGTLAGWVSWAQRFRHEYNHLRPHQALEMKTPAHVYQPVNLRSYRQQPAPWDYGGAPTAVLNGAGCLDLRGGRYFVCEALAGERVRMDQVDHLLLVTFRATTVREIDLRTGRTRAVVLPDSKRV